jgi:hypothetical protein
MKSFTKTIKKTKRPLGIFPAALQNSRSKEKTLGYNAFKFFALLENDETFLNKLDDTDKEFLLDKVSNMSQRIRILDAIFCEAYNINQDKKNETFFTFNFLEDLENNKFLQISKVELSDPEKVKRFIDYTFKALNTQIRTFFSTKYLSLTRANATKELQKAAETYNLSLKTESTKKNKKKLKAKEKVKFEQLVTLAEANLFDPKYTPERLKVLLALHNHPKAEAQAIFKTFRLPIIKEIDFMRIDSMNFISFLDLFHEDDLGGLVFLQVFDSKVAKDHPGFQLFKQAKQYLEQVNLYVLSMYHLHQDHQADIISFIPNLNSFLCNRNTFRIRYADAKDSGFETVLVEETNEPKFIYVKKRPDEKESVVIYHNRFIAFLNQMEDFYFNKLYVLFLLISGNKKN